ncbi:MAG: S-layer homology domain-containing protein [Acidimicrobiaceae bacterium]|nr:S-layer homology domain-containing protein [Acidimicrobiaceae bacterium]MDE0605633.1 S-layer homology domain-containing protein [Acidimicrobiaceae bacterium]
MASKLNTSMMRFVSRLGLTTMLAVGLFAASVAASDGDDSVDAELPAQMPHGFDACWGNIEPVPFADTAYLSAESRAAIDCIYHYGITEGTSAVAYSPEAPVIRLHMAIFLARTGRVLGLDVPEGATGSFDDLASVSDEGRSAVAQLKAMGITTGYSPQVFGPANEVERVHMAHFLARMLRLTGIALPAPEDPVLEDVATLYGSARADISLMVELGIMEPETTDRFGPRAVVTREDMALFLARILDLADIRPVSLELSLSSESLMVGGAATAKVRALKPDGSPYPGLLIDVFADRGWRRGTACNLDIDARLNGGDAGTSQNCRIDVGDPRTDSAGEITVGLAHSAGSAVNWIYAWAGALDQEFNESEVRSEVRQVIEWLPSPTEVTTIEPMHVFYGQGVSIAANLVGPNSAGQRMVLVASYDDVVRVTRAEITKDDGSVSFNVPGLAAPSDDLYLRRLIDETIFVYWDRNANNAHDGPAELSARTMIYWS